MTGTRFCIKCGKSNLKKNELIKNLCFDCYKKGNPLLIIDKDKIPTLILCVNCQNFHFDYSKKWIHPESDFFTDTLSDLETKVDKFVKLNENVDLMMSFLDEDTINYDALKSNRMFKINIAASAMDNPENILEEETITIRVNFSMCEKCNLIQRKASKVKLQFQAKNRELNEEEILYIEEIIENEFEKYLKEDPDAFILEPSKTGKIRRYKISSFKLAKKIANLIKNELNGIIRESFKYEDREKNKSKTRSRSIISVILPTFAVGEIFILNKEIYQVYSIINKSITCINLDNSLKIKFRSSALKHARKLTKEDMTSFLVVSLDKENFQVMDNETFQTFEIPLDLLTQDVKEGMEVKGIKKDNDKIIIIQ